MPYNLKKIRKSILPIKGFIEQRLSLVFLAFIVFFSFNFPQHTIAASSNNLESNEITISSDSSKTIQEYSLFPVNKSLPVVSEKTPVKVITVRATAYNSEVAQTDASPCITANGFNVCESEVEDTIAANFLEFGTKVKIPEYFGDKVFTVRDRMNARYGSGRIDIFMKDKGLAKQFGAKTFQMEIY